MSGEKIDVLMVGPQAPAFAGALEQRYTVLKSKFPLANSLGGKTCGIMGNIGHPILQLAAAPAAIRSTGR
jgi:hypothetical protein